MSDSRTASLNSLKSYLHQNCEEIANSKALRFYGAALAFTHMVTIYFWWNVGFETPLCWSYFPQCAIYTETIFLFFRQILSGYFLISLAAVVFFLANKVRWAIGLFAIATVIKLMIHASDYRFMGNYHYMSHLVNFVFLLMLGKRGLLKVLLVAFYVGAGILKFNPDWMTGFAMIRPPIISGKLLELACAYVIFLEMVLAPLLLWGSQKLKYAILFQLIAFHLFSWHIVGYFYPVIMLCLISLFVLDNSRSPIKLGRGCYAFMIVFILAQLLPFMMEPKSSLNGRMRVLSLNMLDAKAVCESRMYIRFESSTVEYLPEFSHLGLRIQCDPQVYVDRLQRVCTEQSKIAGFVDIDFDHQVRRISDSTDFDQITFKKVCSKPLTMSALGYVEQR
ncbi:MAG: hypothetical protein EOP04_21155 [Proteobacteria bacterium]|nr:MAG: hypothetical protein EOP04_21155 [Pseudomonadota bacterium]